MASGGVSGSVLRMAALTLVPTSSMEYSEQICAKKNQILVPNEHQYAEDDPYSVASLCCPTNR